jgi:hypothetical protein
VPIRAEYRKYYGPEWRKFRKVCLQLAGNVCSRCQRPHRMLNVAHLNHDPKYAVSIAVLCPSCHSKVDTPHRIAMTRRTKARRVRQKWLLPELEFAPLPPRMWPFHLRQMRLFEDQEST